MINNERTETWQQSSSDVPVQNMGTDDALEQEKRYPNREQIVPTGNILNSYIRRGDNEGSSRRETLQEEECFKGHELLDKRRQKYRSETTALDICAVPQTELVGRNCEVQGQPEDLRQ